MSLPLLQLCQLSRSTLKLFKKSPCCLFGDTLWMSMLFQDIWTTDSSLIDDEVWCILSDCLITCAVIHAEPILSNSVVLYAYDIHPALITNWSDSKNPEFLWIHRIQNVGTAATFCHFRHLDGESTSIFQCFLFGMLNQMFVCFCEGT